jgi:hypothetical protein
MSAATISAAQALIATLASTYPASPDFLQSACWADDLKTLDAAQEAPWHFIDLPVIRDNVVAPAPPEENVVTHIDEAQSTVYAKKSTSLDKARQLRFIVHLVGDVHQPLHAASLFSTQFPDGDRGGNSYPITLPAGMQNFTSELHAFWDGGAGAWTGDLSRPLNATGVAWVSELSQSIIAAYPVASLQPFINIYNVSIWAEESNTIANELAYTAPQAPTPLPSSYVTATHDKCLERIAIAGYRLADLLEYIFTVAPAILEPARGPAPTEDVQRIRVVSTRDVRN